MQAWTQCQWQLLNACDVGVPQSRTRLFLIALRPIDAVFFQWPVAQSPPEPVGKVLLDRMAARGWPGAKSWSQAASGIAPTIVGGSKKHGGPDLGPTRARRQWKELSVDGLGIAAEAPGPDFPPDAHPKLTVEMVARLQGFPPSWAFSGKKTAAYRQVGNALPPPMAAAIGSSILTAFEQRGKKRTGLALLDLMLEQAAIPA